MATIPPRPDPDRDILVFAREGDVKACFLVCEDLEPETIDVLLDALVPDGVVIPKVFNAACDAYDLWREAAAIESAPTQARPGSPPLAAAA